MIVALLNQKAVGETALALHLVSEWAGKGKCFALIDADPPYSALNWSQQRARERVTRLFGAIGLARETLHRKAAELAQDVDHLVIDRPPRVTVLMRSASRAADLAPVPAQPSPFAGWASVEVLALLKEAHIYRSKIHARFALNRSSARTVIAREMAATLADLDPSILLTTIEPRVIYASATRSGRLSFEIDDDGPRGARDRRSHHRDRRDRAMMQRSPKHSFTARLSSPESQIRDAGAPPPRIVDVSIFTARLTIDVTPAYCGRIDILAFRHGITVAEMPRKLLAREFPETLGDAQ